MKSVDSVMTYVEAEMARLLAADPTVEAARQRADLAEIEEMA